MHLNGQHGGSVASVAASQQEGPMDVCLKRGPVTTSGSTRRWIDALEWPRNSYKSSSNIFKQLNSLTFIVLEVVVINIYCRNPSYYGFHKLGLRKFVSVFLVPKWKSKWKKLIVFFLAVLSRAGLFIAGLTSSKLRPLHSILSHADVLFPWYFKAHICWYVLQRKNYSCFFFLPHKWGRFPLLSNKMGFRSSNKTPEIRRSYRFGHDR